MFPVPITPTSIFSPPKLNYSSKSIMANDEEEIPTLRFMPTFFRSSFYSGRFIRLINLVIAVWVLMDMFVICYILRPIPSGSVFVGTADV